MGRRKKEAEAPARRDAPDIDCCVCIHRNGCERFAERSFCTKFQAREPDARGMDPNDAWRQGDPFLDIIG